MASSQVKSRGVFTGIKHSQGKDLVIHYRWTLFVLVLAAGSMLIKMSCA